MSGPLDGLIPAPAPEAASYRLGTITSASPWRVRLDGDTAPVASSPIVLTRPAVGARVLVLLHHRRMYVLGEVGGPGDTKPVTEQLTTVHPGWARYTAAGHTPRVTRVGPLVHVTGLMQWVGGGGDIVNILTVPTSFRPATTGTRFVGSGVSSVGSVYDLALTAGVLGIPAGYGTIGGGTPFVPITASWVLD